jgi:hypothetical protein
VKTKGKKKDTQDDITNTVKMKGKKKDTQDATATNMMKKMRMTMRMKNMNPTEVSKREAKEKERMVWKKLSAVQRFVRTLLAPNAQISTTHVPVASVLSTV